MTVTIRDVTLLVSRGSFLYAESESVVDNEQDTSYIRTGASFSPGKPMNKGVSIKEEVIGGQIPIATNLSGNCDGFVGGTENDETDVVDKKMD